MATWTSKQDIIDRWVGADVPQDEDLIDTLIFDAEVVIKSAYPRIQERLDALTLSLDVVKFVVSRMVIRVLRNPDNLGTHQQSTGPFSESRTYRGETDIWLSDSEKNMLAPSNSRKAGSISPLDGSRKQYVYSSLDSVEFKEYVEEDVLDRGTTTVNSDDALADYNKYLEARDED
jgi:hypothetical protein